MPFLWQQYGSLNTMHPHYKLANIAHPRTTPLDGIDDAP